MVLYEYDSEMVRPAGGASLANGKALTVEAWIAPPYPWNLAPIVMRRDESPVYLAGKYGIKARYRDERQVPRHTPPVTTARSPGILARQSIICFP